MKINILLNPVSYVDYKNQTMVFGWEPTDKRMGGTEESVREWGKELVKRGHQVSVYRNETLNPVHELDGVKYLPRNDYQGGGDICVNIKSSDVPPKEPTLYLTNEVDLKDVDLSAYLGVIWPSQWAVDNYPVNNRTFILPHGYDSTNVYPAEKVRKQCIYASSPDRGLHILEQVWPLVVDAHPDAHLYVTYGGRLNAENTTYGEFTEKEMNKLFRESEFWLHPCTGGELFGMAGIKAQAAHCIPIYYPAMALVETVRAGVKCQDPRELYEAIVRLMDDVDECNMIRKRLAGIKFDNWEDSTDILEYIIKQVV